MRIRSTCTRTQVVWILPPKSYLQIVILHNEIHEPIQEVTTFLFRETIDLLDMTSHSKHRFPARDWVRSDHGMNGL